MIDFAVDGIAVGDKQSTLEQPKKGVYELSAAMLINLVDSKFVELYRAEREPISNVYTDVRIQLSEREIIDLTLDEFIKRIRG